MSVVVGQTQIIPVVFWPVLAFLVSCGNNGFFMKEIFLFCVLSCFCWETSGQEPQHTEGLKDLTAFVSPGPNWQIVGNVNASLSEKEKIQVKPGQGILVNLPSEGSKKNLLTKLEHGDIDFELEVMMAAHSNSGIYLQGRYEIQLFDSWGKKVPAFSDMGGIYHGTTKDGKKIEGHAPRVNVALAPGLWQKLKVSFEAPVFDSKGAKVKNAKILSLELNGHTILKNVELTGPSGAPVSKEEAPLGPIKFQGDHGPVAFRNIRYTLFDNKAPTFGPVKYTVYRGSSEDLKSLSLEGHEDYSGNNEGINWKMSKYDNEYAISLEGELAVPEDGDYLLAIKAGGYSDLSVKGKTIISNAWSHVNQPPHGNQVFLKKGRHAVKIRYAKVVAWEPAGLGLFISAKTLRAVALHEKSSLLGSNNSNPIYLNADKTTVLRSFSRFGNEMLTRTIHVGHEENLHYTYNMENGSILRIWKGPFLDNTSMWDGRGNGVASPAGAVLSFDNITDVAVLKGRNDDWPGNEAQKNFRFLGYDIERAGSPVFRYLLQGTEVTDRISIEDGKYFKRSVVINEEKGGYYVLLAKAATINEQGDGLYTIGDKKYYVQVAPSVSDRVFIRTNEGGQELLAPVSGEEFIYSIIW